MLLMFRRGAIETDPKCVHADTMRAITATPATAFSHTNAAATVFRPPAGHRLRKNSVADTVLAITLWQPWATLVAEELKPFEFRGWPAPQRVVGQRIGIHAGARPVRRSEIADLINTLSGDEWRTTGINDRAKALDLLERVWRAFRPKGSNDALALSHVVCTALLGQPIRDEDLAKKLSLPGINDSGRSEHSNYGWPLTSVERLEPPVPARGARGFWPWKRDDA
jgi:hypothetical protein